MCVWEREKEREKRALRPNVVAMPITFLVVLIRSLHTLTGKRKHAAWRRTTAEACSATKARHSNFSTRMMGKDSEADAFKLRSDHVEPNRIFSRTGLVPSTAPQLWAK